MENQHAFRSTFARRVACHRRVVRRAIGRTTSLPVALAVFLALAQPAIAQTDPPPTDDTAPPPPTEIEPSPLVSRIIDDPITTDAQRRELRIFHGRWSDLDVDALSPPHQARLALLRYDLDHPSLTGPHAPPLIRAAAALAAGRPAEALDILDDAADIESLHVRATAHERLGQLPDATALLQRIRDQVAHEQLTDPAALTTAAEALATLARLEGRPAQDYQLAMTLLARAREHDPLHWPARIVEGRLLIDKDNRAQGGEALLEALSLNPAAGEAWYELGMLAVEGFDFERATLAAEKLRAINAVHPLADRLDARSRLQQRDVTGARAIVETQLARHRDHRQWLALLAAVEALSFDEPGTQAVLEHFDRLSPASPAAHFLVGSVLSAARQYDWGEQVLREAIRRQPNWPAAWIELGLLLMQNGDLPQARAALARAAQLDPFNRRANNQLQLAEDLLGYETIETEHFLIRYRDGIDAVLARDMPDELERLHRELTGVFQHVPGRKTQIDIMPDEQHFGVRITGMPEIWTIAAATGDVISLTPPRQGPRQRGPYHWVNVLRHEFVHTITLSQTGNRIPHWFTEACAVSQETTGRTYDTCQLLAWALHHDKLFTLDQINWGFIRPRTPRDRPLAYAQADWMLEYLAAHFGHASIVRLLTLYGQGIDDAEAMRQVTGLEPDAFMTQFTQWASQQVRQWGLAPREGDDAVRHALQSGEPLTADRLADLLEQYPGHPDLLKQRARQAVDADDPVEAERAVLRYAAARPVDPWPHRALVRLAAASGDLDRAVPSLQQLDLQDTYNSAWSHQLAQIHRAQGRLDRAADAIRRALFREPYNANFRTLAATIDLQRGEAGAALHHLESLAMLEPDRAVHAIRLAALYDRLGRRDDAAAAARRARDLQPDAPVDRYLRD